MIKKLKNVLYFHLPYLCDFRKLAFVLALVMALVIASSTATFAEEHLTVYPPLPKGYTSTRVFDCQGRFVGRILPDKRYSVGIDQIPVFLQKALIAIEDARFYEHGGIDVRGTARALVKDVIKGRMVEGGSTITQQLIKNLYSQREKTIERKVREGILAIEYERKYTKRQILEMYFNEIYFGNGAWGIAQAARLYFDKSPQDLNEIESLLLAAVPKAPNRYNPTSDPTRVDMRKNLIIKRMLALKMITPRQARKLRSSRGTVMKANEAPSYLAHVRGKLIERFGADIIELGGLDVTTAMDLPMQRLAEKTLAEGVRRISPDLQGAMIAIDPNTGDVLTAVGGVDFAKNAYDRTFYARRQPGSAIKPLIYAAAVERGCTAGMIWNDSVVAYNRGNNQTWSPQNYEKKHYGDLSLRQALAYSNNVIAVKLLESIGVPYFVDFATRLGLKLRSPNDLSLALGSEELTLHDLVSAYMPLSNGGLQYQSRTILRICDRQRQTCSESPPSAQVPVLDPAVAYVTTQLMKDVLTVGTAKVLKIFAQKRPAAGKTGTTDDYRDAWFIGYTPQVIAGVWMGYDKPKPGGPGFTGGTVCAPIWERFMRGTQSGKPIVDFIKPDTVVSVMIDSTTGELATPQCQDKREEYYIKGTEPTKPCAKHGGVSPETVAPVSDPVPSLLFPETRRTDKSSQ